MSETAYNIIGFAGSLLILLGFYRVSIGRWTNKSVWYELDNLVVAALIVIYQVHNRTYVTVVLNVVWIIVAFKGLTSFAARYNYKARKRAKHRR